MQKVIFLVLIICGLSTAQIKSEGRCPEVQVQKDFQLNKFMGQWYEIEKYPLKRQIGLKCTKAEYTLLSNQSIAFIDTALSTITNEPVRAQGIANLVEEGTIQVEHPNLKKSKYLILGTDYTSYSVLYSCSENGDGRTERNEFAWILTRSIFPTQSVMENARNVLADNGISTDYLTQTSQLRCFDI